MDEDGRFIMSKQIIDMMRREYTMRLLEALTETDLLDKSGKVVVGTGLKVCLLYTSPSPRDGLLSRMPSSA